MDIEFLNNSNGFKNKKAIKYADDIEPHESLLDKLAQRSEEKMGSSSRKFEVLLSGRVLKSFFILSVVLIILLFGKVFQMQVLEGKNYDAKAAANEFAISQIESERGVIYDQNMNQLVYNVPSFDLVVNPSALPKDSFKRSQVISEVSQIINADPNTLSNDINDSSNTATVVVSQNLSHETVIALETKINELTGFEINQDWTRQYPNGSYFSDIIGYTGQISTAELKNSSGYLPTDWVGKAGLEKSYESVLRKDPGELQIQRNALGNEISEKVIEQPKSGDSLVLWLNSGLQEEITNTLEDIAKQVGVTNASAVALDPNTGGVLSMVSIPNFDNNLFNKGANQTELSELISGKLPDQSLFNLAIAGQFPSGSTIKPLLASGILQENIISPDKQIYCGPYIEIPNPWDPSNPTIKRDWTTHGWTDLKQAIAESSDVYFYIVGGGFGDQKGLGMANIDKYLALFGWGQDTGIDLPGETPGLVPSPAWMENTENKTWTAGDTYNITIGQGDMLVTPIQMAASFVPIANGGTLYKPQVVQKIIDSQKNVVKDFTPQIVRQNFVDQANLEVVREGMREAVTGQNAPLASAVELNSLPIAVAAKTGTAQTGKFVNGTELLDNWITLFAPYNDPKIVLTIMFQDVKGEQLATLPAAEDILQWYFSQGSTTTAATSSLAATSSSVN